MDLPPSRAMAERRSLTRQRGSEVDLPKGMAMADSPGQTMPGCSTLPGAIRTGTTGFHRD